MLVEVYSGGSAAQLAGVYESFQLEVRVAKARGVARHGF